jgi:AcrR family transcriptional regulator
MIKTNDSGSVSGLAVWIGHGMSPSCERLSRGWWNGYDRVSMDDIAARAHAGKGAIYRRWPSKAALVVDAIVWRREQMGAVTVPDTGSLRSDVEALIAAVPDFDDAGRSMMGIFLGVATAAGRDPALGRRTR